MNIINSMKLGGVLAALCIAPAAMAQDYSGTMQDNKNTIGEGQAPQDLPRPQSDNDPQPAVSSPVTPETGVVEQAGVGGKMAYGRAGVLEFGGSAGFTRAGDLTQVNFSPSIGWFFMDNLQLSGIIGVNYSNVEGEGSSYFSAVVEPSFHLPFSKTLFGFLGVGAGLAYAQDQGVGFNLAPRVGMNALIGRSGILTPALYLGYTTHDVAQAGNTTVLGVSVSYGLNIGYTVMF